MCVLKNLCLRKEFKDENVKIGWGLGWIKWVVVFWDFDGIVGWGVLNFLFEKYEMFFEWKSDVLRLWLVNNIVILLVNIVIYYNSKNMVLIMICKLWKFVVIKKIEL